MTSRFARNTALSSIAGLVYSLGRFATTIVVARTLGVSETGSVSYALWIISLVGAIADGGVYASLTRYLPELTRGKARSEADRLSTLLFAGFSVLTAVSFLGFFLVAALKFYDGHLGSSLGIEGSASRWLLIACLYAAQAMSNFALGYLQGMQQFARVALAASVAMALQLVIVAIGGGFWGADGALLGYLVGALVPGSLCLTVIGRNCHISEDLRRRLLRYAAYSWASTLASAFIWGRLEVAFLFYFWGSSAVGLYSVGFTLASLATQGPMLLTGGLLPYFSERAGEKDREDVNNMLSTGSRWLAFVILPLCFGAAGLVPSLLPLIYGVDFSAGAFAATVLVAAAGFGANTAVPSTLINAMERSDFVFVCNTVGAILSVALAAALVPRYGLEGAAFSRGAVQLYVLGLDLWFIRNRLGFILPLNHLLRLVIAASACALTARLVLLGVPGVLGLLVAILLSASVYFALVRMLGALPRRDLELLRPFLGRLPSMLRRLLWGVLVLLAVPKAK